MRDEERRLTAAPQTKCFYFRSKDREAVATLQSGGRSFRCDLLTCLADVYDGS